MYYKSVSAIAGGGKTAVLLNTFSKGLARCSGSNWVFFPDPNWLCAPGANSAELHTDDLLTEAILKLPEQQRHVIWLKYYHGYNLREISKMLGITLSWAQKIDQRAKKQLEMLYKEGGGEF